MKRYFAALCALCLLLLDAALAETNIRLADAGVEAGADLRAIDLVAAAREYILSTGLSTEEVDALYANLAKDYSAEF